MTRRVSIDIDHRGLGSIHADGHDLSRLVSGFEIDGHVGSTTVIMLHLRGGLAAELDADVDLDSPTRQLLTQLGWTPPEVTP